MERNSTYKWVKYKFQRERGFVLILIVGTIVLALSYGSILITKTLSIANRTELLLQLTSSLQQTNSGSSPNQMYYLACNSLDTEFRISDIDPRACQEKSLPYTGGATPVEVSFNNVSNRENTATCNFKFRYYPKAERDNYVEGEKLCIEVSDCEYKSPILLSLFSTKFGATSCVQKPPVIADLAINLSRQYTNLSFTNPVDNKIPVSLMYGELYNGSHFTSSLSSDEISRAGYSILRDSPPGYFESFDGDPTCFSATLSPPFADCTLPFATKEYSVSGAIANADSALSSLADTSFINAMPNVVPQTDDHKTLPTITNEPDPIQYMINIDQSYVQGFTDLSLRWATHQYTEGSLFRWRHGALTQHWLTNTCFSPYLMVQKYAAQHLMYYLDAFDIPFGAHAYSNWILPLTPLIPYSHRLQEKTFSTDRYKTLKYGLLGPNDDNFLSIPDPNYIATQFGNINSSITGGIYNRNTAYQLTINPMSICARETSLVTQTTSIGSNIKPYRALYNPYEPTTKIEADNDDTRCKDPFFMIPPPKRESTVIGQGTPTYPYAFVFRGQTSAGAGATPPSDFVDPDTGLQCPVKAGNCFGDLVKPITIFGTTILTPDPSDVLFTFFEDSYPCQIANSSPSNTITPPLKNGDAYNLSACSVNNASAVKGHPTEDPVSSADMTDPYRLCPDADPQEDLDSFLAEIPPSFALQTLRGGAFSKSGWPMNNLPTMNDSVPNSTNLYFTTPADANVYPNKGPLYHDFTSGAVEILYESLTDKALFNPQELIHTKRVAILLTDGFFSRAIGLKDVITDNVGQAAWFKPNPTTIPLNPYVSSNNSTYNSPSILETLNIIHNMVDNGIEVVVVLLNYDNSILPTQNLEFFKTALREPIGGTGTATDTTYGYAVCRPCQGGIPEPLNGDPSITDPAQACECVNKPIRQGIHLVEVRRIMDGNYGQYFEPWSSFLNRALKAISLKIFYVVNKAKFVK